MIQSMKLFRRFPDILFRSEEQAQTVHNIKNREPIVSEETSADLGTSRAIVALDTDARRLDRRVVAYLESVLSTLSCYSKAGERVLK